MCNRMVNAGRNGDCHKWRLCPPLHVCGRVDDLSPHCTYTFALSFRAFPQLSPLSPSPTITSVSLTLKNT